LKIRSEVLTALENINGTLRELQLENEDFSLNLFFQPETFERPNWLLEVSKFLYQSPKPESILVNKSGIEKFLTRSQNLH